MQRTQLSKELVRACHPVWVGSLTLKQPMWNFLKMMHDSPKIQAEFFAMRTLPERVWFVKKAIRSKTWMNDTVDLKHSLVAEMPDGLDMYECTELTTSLMPQVRREIASLFDEELAKLPHERIIMQDMRATRGLTFIFTTDEKTGERRRVMYTDGLAVISSHCPNLARVAQEYARQLCILFGITHETFEKHATMQLLRYEPMSGIWVHLDNVARTDGGPIATINIGPPTVDCDFMPSLVRDKVPCRIRLRETNMLVMRGRFVFACFPRHCVC